MNISLLTPPQLASKIDHTFLQAHGGPDLIENLCEEAKRYGFACVMVNPAEVARCSKLLSGSSTKVGTVIGFPLGQNTVATKLFEVEDAIEIGAQEVDLVINQRALRAEALEIVKAEIFGLSEICRPHGVISKVILECCNLTDEEKIAVCKIIAEAQCDFAKTSTGFGAHGATVHDVKLMRENLPASVSIKAAGGIRSLSDALSMLEAGASRLGTSGGVVIMQELSGTNKSITGSSTSY